ncbi:LapA family protein [Vibrio algicola]|uniref:Probable lipopolysaccharide assembly protein A n=1 Tax=Vibrio algicola TaxID=2662262 RepID=A0A5Q0TF79_9VIBR|nr:lipopolysaccharide assembly protein LapA domain-containing protein [Vibrio algicola]
MKVIKIIIAIALFLIALALGAQNQEMVKFNYLIAQNEFHLSTLLGGVFIVAFGLAWLIFGSLYLKSKLTIARLRKQLAKSKKSVSSSSSSLPDIKG